MTLLKQLYPVARKEHECELCREKINVGQKYVRQTIVEDGVYDFICHEKCMAVGNELVDCGSDEGYNEVGFCNSIDDYIRDNHTNEQEDWWKLNYHEKAIKIREEL